MLARFCFALLQLHAVFSFSIRISSSIPDVLVSRSSITDISLVLPHCPPGRRLRHVANKVLALSAADKNLMSWNHCKKPDQHFAPSLSRRVSKDFKELAKNYCDVPLTGRRDFVALSLLTFSIPCSAQIQKSETLENPGAVPAYPSQQQIDRVRLAIRAFDRKELKEADVLFSEAISNWEQMKRPRDEMAELYKMRGNVRVDLKAFAAAKGDYDMVLSMMTDGEKADGTAAYVEYPDTYVQRGLCFEGLGDWEHAILDYTKAVSLWGGGRGQGINPYVLTFRANALTKVGRYQDAVEDYRAAEGLFLSRREEERALDCRANGALALYEMGQTATAVQAMKEIVRRRPGYADMHVALAAHLWSVGDAAAAEGEWEFACNQISVGCRAYKDLEWVSTVRRWPPSLAAKLARFQSKQATP